MARSASAVFLVRAFFGPALGHGRATEGSLCLALWLTGLFLICFKGSAAHSRIAGDLFQAGWGILLVLPILLAAGLSTMGLVFNVTGMPHSHLLRIVGALLGAYFWAWFLYKSYVVGLDGTPVAALLIRCLYDTTRVVVFAFAGLPVAGAPGNLPR